MNRYHVGPTSTTVEEQAAHKRLLTASIGIPYESGSTNKGTAMETIGRHHEKLLKLPTLACENLSRDFTNSTGAP